jgi:hypothetical protein
MPRGIITVKLLEKGKIIQRKILRAAAKELNNIFRRSGSGINRDFRKFVNDVIIAQPEIQELSGGILQGAFGIPRGMETAAIDNIIIAIVDSIFIELRDIKESGSKVLKGGMSIYIQPSNFSNLLSLPTGSVTIKGGSIPWLQWLLTAGDKVLIGDFDVHYKSGLGRSGLAHMRAKSGAFRVPPSYSGTEDNNFITRAFIGTESRFIEILRKNLK